MVTRRPRLAAAVRGVALTLTLASMGGGCGSRARLERDPAFAERFTRRGQNESTEARIEGDRLYGATIEIRRIAPGVYAGRLNGLPAELRATPGKLTGSVGNLPTDLDVSVHGDAVRIHGMFGGALGTLDVTPRFVRGKVGACSYALTREGDSPWYEGKTVCGGAGVEFGDVAFPRDLAARPVEERAALSAPR